MRSLLLSIICLLSLTCTAQSQTGSVRIRLTEEGSGLPLAGITVRVNGRVQAVSNAQGQATLPASLLPARITFTGTGFETMRQQWTAEANEHNVVLSPRVNGLKETVVTGIPRPIRLKNALSQYRVISAEDNKAQGNITLADALSTQLNINIGSDQVLGSTVKMQGMSGSNIKVLIDGLPVNGRENGNIDMGQINLNNIARVEIVQGPMSVVYGSDALGGVINLITKQQTKPWSLNGGFNYESVGKYNADAALTRTWKHHNLTIGGGRNYFNGWGDLDTQQDGQLHRQLLWKPKEQYLANAAYTYTSDSGFRLQLASDLVREKLTNKGQAHVDPFSGYAIDEYYRTTRANNRLMLSGRLGKKGHWESRNGYALYHRTRSRLFRNMVNLEETPTQNAGDQDTSTFHDINLRSNYSNTYMRLKYDAGYDVNLEFARSGKIPGGTRQIGDYGLYQNFAYDLLPDKLTLQAGLREIYNTRYSAPFIYSFNALYTPAPKVQLRASYAKGFRAPTLKEQYLQFVDQNHYITGNPNLKAERSDALQASASWQVYERRSDYVQLILTGFYNNHYDKIILAKTDTFPANNKYQYVNLSRMQNVIGNLQMEQQWQNLHLVLEYGVQYYWKQAGLYDAYTVNEIVVRGQYYWSNPGLSFSAFYKLNGASPNIVEGIDGTVTTNGKLPSYSMLDLSLSKKFWNRRLELIAGVKNVLDVRQVTAAGAQQGGGPHGSESGGGVLLPRRLFTTLRLNL